MKNQYLLDTRTAEYRYIASEAKKDKDGAAKTNKDGKKLYTVQLLETTEGNTLGDVLKVSVPESGLGNLAPLTAVKPVNLRIGFLVSQSGAGISYFTADSLAPVK